MGQTKELIKAYFPLVAAVVIISLLHIQVVKGWGLNLSLLMLVGSELSLMLRQRQNGKDADLVEALMKGPPKRTRDEALLLAHLPRIAVEILASWTMPRHEPRINGTVCDAVYQQHVIIFQRRGNRDG